MPEVQEKIWGNFRLGWNPYQIPPAPAMPDGHLYPFLMEEGQMVECQGLRAGSDGVLRKHRDQYRIHGAAVEDETMTALWEFKTSTRNQLLAIWTDGSVWRLDADWDNAVADQWDYGYELFKSVPWRRCGQPLPYGTEDFADWTETDPGSHLTLSRRRVLATGLVGSDAAHVTKDLASIGQFRWEFSFRVTALASDSVVCLVGMSSSGSVVDSWGLYVHVWNSVPHVTMYPPYNPGKPIELDTTYYVIFEPEWPFAPNPENRIAKFYLYTDPDYSDLEPIVIWDTKWVPDLRYAHMMVPQDGTAATFSGWVENLILTELVVGGDLPQTQPFAFAQARNQLFVSHRDMATRVWDGRYLLEAGLLPPTSPLTGDSTAEDLTDGWVETDTGSYLGVAADKVTATSMPSNAASRLSKDLTAIGAFDWRFIVQVDSAEALANLTLLCASDQDGPPSEYHKGLRVYALESLGTVELYLGYGASETVKTLAFGVPYYCRLASDGVRIATLYVHMADDYSDEPWTSATWYPMADQRYVVLACAGVLSNTAKMTATVSEVDLGGVSTGTGVLPAGTYHYVCTYVFADALGNVLWESCPSPVSAPMVLTGSHSLLLKGIPLGPEPPGDWQTWRKLYRSYTVSVDPGAEGADYLWMATIQDNTTTTFTDNVSAGYLGAPAPVGNGIPPRGDLMLWHNDRLWVAGLSCTSRSFSGYETTGLNNLLMWSELGSPAYFGANNYVRVGNDNRILNLLPAPNGGILILKEGSMWLLTGYDDSLSEGDFELHCLSSATGGTTLRGGAAGPEGCVWESVAGMMFWDGSNLRKLVDYNYATWAPRDPAATDPLLAYNRGKFFIRDYIWEPETDAWQQYGVEQVGNVGLLGFELGARQSHVLTETQWVSAGDNEITVLETGDPFGYADGEGYTYTSWYGQVALTFPPLLAGPGEEIVLLEFEVDGYWPNSHTEPPSATVLTTKRAQVYLNEDGEYSVTLGHNAWPSTTLTLLSGQGVVGVPPGYPYSTASLRSNAQAIWYLQMSGECMSNCEIRGVRFKFYRRKRGVNIGT